MKQHLYAASVAALALLAALVTGVDSTALAFVVAGSLYTPIEIGDITFAANQLKKLDLDKDGILRQLDLRFRYTVTNGASSPTTALFNALATLADRIFVDVGRDQPVAISGRMLAALNRIESGVRSDGMEDTVVTTATAATAYDVTLSVHCDAPRSARPQDCGLDLRNKPSATVGVQWADSGCSKMFLQPSAAAISAVTCTVTGHYDQLGQGEDPGTLFVREIREQEFIPTATGKFPMLMDGRTGVAYMATLLRVLDDDEADNTQVASAMVKVEAGARTFFKARWPAQQAWNKRQCGLVDGIQSGELWIDHRRAGSLAQGIATGNLPADLKINIEDFTVESGTNKILAVSEIWRGLRT